MKKLIFAVLFLLITAAAFAADFYNLKGDSLSYEQIVSSPNTVLFLWASWCPHCREELAHLNDICKKDAQVKFFYVDLGEQVNRVKLEVEQLALKKCVENNIIVDSNAYIAKMFSVIGIPTFIFFKDGRPIYKSYYFYSEMLDKIYNR